MLILLEWDGVLAEVMAGYHRAHQQCAAKVGWSALDSARFRAAMRKQGPDAQVLPGAPLPKVKTYRELFVAALESDDVLRATPLHESAAVHLRAIARHATLICTTLGTNLAARQEVLQKGGIAGLCKQSVTLDPDPRRRPGQLRTLFGSEKRTLVAATSEPLLRAAGSADIIAVGFSSGAASSARLQQAGADIVYGGLDELAETLTCGAPDLVRAGLLPLPLG